MRERARDAGRALRRVRGLNTDACVCRKREGAEKEAAKAAAAKAADDDKAAIERAELAEKAAEAEEQARKDEVSLHRDLRSCLPKISTPAVRSSPGGLRSARILC